MKEKLYILMQTTDDGTQIRVESAELYYGIRKRKDAEKHFAAEHYISTLENYKKRYERACKDENEPARKEILADIQSLVNDYHGLPAKDYLGKLNFFVMGYV
ncbi:hypothetical protein [Streptococcus gallolyticus]|uniref:hypothetical protein n=1 Tax=Streptococcus gallolyticus TaxID=315405 RepID=UPI0022842DE1|nr:hypothetical protein [Streptococcus gallolyticus]MCY7187348.1 hypothetical protein [Streptococcus gallolyticus subsp. gallolyticus]